MFYESNEMFTKSNIQVSQFIPWKWMWKLTLNKCYYKEMFIER